VCRALELGSDTHLVEIGGGWGGLAMHAASEYGCRVTTTTISAEQRAYAEARIQRAGLDSLVRVIGHDYRELEGRFDRLASIEMIEAVGWQYLDRFFSRCSELLAPDGLMFLQAICVDDRAYEAEKDAPSFSNRLIFPGGFLPSVEAISRSLARQTDLRTLWLEDISPSYVLTLRAWRERFLAAEERLRQLGYDRRFRRLWEIYFAISEAGFARRASWTSRCSAPSRPGAHRSAARWRPGNRAVEPRLRIGDLRQRTQVTPSGWRPASARRRPAARARAGSRPAAPGAARRRGRSATRPGAGTARPPSFPPRCARAPWWRGRGRRGASRR
jgi:cyclopropane-fatty-acyl-phospholipid synthase